jgi:NADPH-dependent F420 reductase
MKIAVIGTGNVGGTLGRRWAEQGHEVVFGARDPDAEKVRDVLLSAGSNARAAAIADAAASATVVVLATPWSAAQSAIEAAGNLSGKIVVDCTNPIRTGLTGLALAVDTSAGEHIAQWAPGARVVKAFNTIGSKNMADPIYGRDKATLLVCGDDAEAKETVGDLATQLDFDVIDAGGLDAARHLEAFALLWIHMAYGAGLGEHFAFRVVRR